MMRRFVNILAEKGSTGAYSLHRLDVTKHLFYPSTAEAVAANKPAIERLGQLPEPCVSFQPSPTVTEAPDPPRLQWFALLSPRSSEGRILYGSTTGNIALFDADTNSIQCMPAIPGPKGFMPITISVARPGAPEEDLYVMHPIPAMRGPCFDVLRFGRNIYRGEEMGRSLAWRWISLPPPPLATPIGAHAVLDGGRTICVSATPRHMGTYCFDTVRREWWQAADDWELPFEGGAEYVPDLKLWLGFASGTHQLCASSDLSADAAAAAGAKPPTLKHFSGFETPKEWKAVANPKLLSLGSGRFCIAKIFQGARNTPSGGEFSDLAGQEFAVLSGAEILTGSGDNKPEEEEDAQRLQMVKHKSVLYMFLDGRIDSVL